jgi:hypothetical protein
VPDYKKIDEKKAGLSPAFFKGVAKLARRCRPANLKRIA